MGPGHDCVANWYVVVLICVVVAAPMPCPAWLPAVLTRLHPPPSHTTSPPAPNTRAHPVVGDGLWMLHAHSRIKFVEVLLDVIMALLRQRKSIAYIVVGAVVAQATFLYMWSSLLVAVLQSSADNASAWAMALLLLISLRWTCGFIKHVVSVTVSGTVMAHLYDQAARGERVMALEGDVDLGLDLDEEAHIGLGSQAANPPNECVRPFPLPPPSQPCLLECVRVCHVPTLRVLSCPEHPHCTVWGCERPWGRSEPWWVWWVGVGWCKPILRAVFGGKSVLPGCVGMCGLAGPSPRMWALSAALAKTHQPLVTALASAPAAAPREPMPLQLNPLPAAWLERPLGPASLKSTCVKP
jgi:hypothetical protein